MRSTECHQGYYRDNNENAMLTAIDCSLTSSDFAA